MQGPASSAQPRPWFWIVAILGLLWNAFGVLQFVNSLGSAETLIRQGLTPAQATLYTNLPFWMPVVFALGVGGGVVGSILLLLRRRAAVPVFLGSLLAYIVLFIGDVTLGVFEAFGSQQVMILTTVVAVAAALYALSLSLKKRGVLA